MERDETKTWDAVLNVTRREATTGVHLEKLFKDRLWEKQDILLYISETLEGHVARTTAEKQNAYTTTVYGIPQSVAGQAFELEMNTISAERGSIDRAHTVGRQFVEEWRKTRAKNNPGERMLIDQIHVRNLATSEELWFEPDQFAPVPEKLRVQVAPDWLDSDRKAFPEMSVGFWVQLK